MKSVIKINAHDVNLINFPSGEIQIEVPENNISVISNIIRADIKCHDGLMALLQLNELLDNTRQHNILYLPYLPYSRYDRKMKSHDVLSLKVFCNIINNMGFYKVYTDDCHSYVGLNLLDNCINVPQDIIALNTVLDINTYDAIVSPDAGALKKIFDIAKKTGLPVIECGKMRDIQTGKLTSFTINENTFSNNYKNVLIVDDICDGGGTFIGISNLLKSFGVEQVSLYVTHGIFSKGKGVLNNELDKIYCRHDWTNPSYYENCNNYPLNYKVCNK